MLSGTIHLSNTDVPPLSMRPTGALSTIDATRFGRNCLGLMYTVRVCLEYQRSEIGIRPVEAGGSVHRPYHNALLVYRPDEMPELPKLSWLKTYTYRNHRAGGVTQLIHADENDSGGEPTALRPPALDIWERWYEAVYHRAGNPGAVAPWPNGCTATLCDERNQPVPLHFGVDAATAVGNYLFSHNAKLIIEMSDHIHIWLDPFPPFQLKEIIKLWTKVEIRVGNQEFRSVSGWQYFEVKNGVAQAPRWSDNLLIPEPEPLAGLHGQQVLGRFGYNQGGG